MAMFQVSLTIFHIFTTGNGTDKTHPGGRTFGVTWIDSNDNLYLFGGSGFGDSTVSAPGTFSTYHIPTIGWLGDLWVYNQSTTFWAYLGGPRTADAFADFNYGDMGMPNANNMPPQRVGSNSWMQGDRILYMFGGQSDYNVSTQLRVMCSKNRYR